MQQCLGSWKLIAGIYLALLSAVCSAQPTPNVVLIFTDDQQFNALAANGNTVLQSPTMDLIASGGVNFTQARAALPVCSPSRATIVTGQYNQTNGVENLGQSVNAASPRLGVELQNAGYATGVTGKWHLGNGLDQTALGFDYFATVDGNGGYYRNYNDISDPAAPAKPSGQHIDAYAADRSADFIDQSNAANKPFFLWHNTQTPHVNGGLVWDALPENLARYDATDFYDPANGVNKLPGNWDDDLTNKPEYYATIRNRDLAQNDNRYLYGNPNELADHTSEYYAVITELDDMLTPVIDKLQNTDDPRNPGHKLIDNTYVIFMSDNGWLMGDHGMTSKSLPFDQASRVPMMVMGPGVDVGRLDDRQVSNVDIAPTILDLAGAAAPAGMQGQSIASLFSDGGAGAGVRDTNIVQIWESTFSGNKPILAGYDGRYEVFYTYDEESDALPSFVEIYDTQNDPWELDNLAGDLRNHPGAHTAWRAIQADIQTHRVDDIGTFSHATHTVAAGQTLSIEKNLPAPDGVADQTIPRVIAADALVQAGGTAEGDGVVLGDLQIQNGGTLSLGRGASVPGLIRADFNDLPLNADLNGQGGGEGWTGLWSANDSGSGGTIAVRNGDLSAPGATGYAVSQSPDAAQHIRRVSDGASTKRRDLGETLTGEVWFSFLAKVDENGRAGINIDGHAGFDDNRLLLRAESAGTVLDFFVQGSPNNLADFVPDAAGVTDTQLVLGKLTLNPGNDLLEWWVNPDVTLGRTGLNGSADASYLLNDRDFDEDDGTPGIQKWSVHAYQGGQIDNLVISNTSNAYFDVTGFDDGLGSPATAVTSAGTLSVNGDFTQAANASLRADILGQAETEFDRLIVDGSAALDGALVLATDEDNLPGFYTALEIIEAGGGVSGRFSELEGISLPNTPESDALAVTYTPTHVVVQRALSGDANLDGMISQADLDAVLLNWGSVTATWSTGDYDGNGTVTQSDLDTVLLNWGMTVDEPGASRNVPEPAAGGLCLMAWGFFLRRPRAIASRF